MYPPTIISKLIGGCSNQRHLFILNDKESFWPTCISIVKVVVHLVDKNGQLELIILLEVIGRFEPLLDGCVLTYAHMLSQRPLILGMCFRDIHRHEIGNVSPTFRQAIDFFNGLSKRGSASRAHKHNKRERIVEGFHIFEQGGFFSIISE